MHSIVIILLQVRLASSFCLKSMRNDENNVTLAGEKSSTSIHGSTTGNQAHIRESRNQVSFSNRRSLIQSVHDVVANTILVLSIRNITQSCLKVCSFNHEQPTLLRRWKN